jgi:predicted PurR-regulated permease PerM
MNKIDRYSYLSVFLVLVMAGWLHLAVPFLTVLFAYFALDRLDFCRNKPLTVIFFLTLVAGVFMAFVMFLKEALVALPNIVSTTIPLIVSFAQQHKINLPFDDVESLKTVAMKTVNGEMGNVTRFARLATKETVFVVLGLVIAITLFLKPHLDLEADGCGVEDNLYSAWCRAVLERFRSFYRSFATVMGAQLTISAINTVLTAIFVIAISLPHALVIVGLTLLCGMLPIIGNLVSNSVIVAICFTLSPQMALASLIFLIALHKFEYFLNSKVIGDRIKNPIWLTLIGLIVGEKLMGIAGMILAPVVLNYLRIETSKIELKEKSDLAFAGEEN